MTPDREAAIDKLTTIIGEKFRCFGGGNVTVGNPISHVLQDRELQFAAGVEVRPVVEYVYDAGASASQARVEALESALDRIATQDSDIYVMCRTIIDGKDANHYRTAYESLNMASQVARAALR